MMSWKVSGKSLCTPPPSPPAAGVDNWLVSGVWWSLRAAWTIKELLSSGAGRSVIYP